MALASIAATSVARHRDFNASAYSTGSEGASTGESLMVGLQFGMATEMTACSWKGVARKGYPSLVPLRKTSTEGESRTPSAGK